jgi:cytochrome c5
MEEVGAATAEVRAGRGAVTVEVRAPKQAVRGVATGAARAISAEGAAVMDAVCTVCGAADASTAASGPAYLL